MKTQDEEIEDFVRNYFKKLDTGKVPSVTNFYSPGASVVIGRERFSGKEEVKGFYREFFTRMANTKHDLKNIKVETSGFEVIVTLDWRLTAYIKKIAKSVTILGSGKLWLLYEEEKWRIVEHDIFVNFTKTLLRHGPLNFLNLIRAKDQFEF
ncbi:MAG: YybH family protein [Candidatus Hydrothermarchaeales archaeon]